MAKQTVKISENKLRKIVETHVREVVKENFFSNIKNKIDDTFKGYDTLEGNPTSIEDVFKGDGWIVQGTIEEPDGTVYKVKRTMGRMGAFEGKEIQEMVEELNIFLNGNGTAKYYGRSNTNAKTEYFKIFK